MKLFLLLLVVGWAFLMVLAITPRFVESQTNPPLPPPDPMCIVDEGHIYQERAFVLFFCDNETRLFRIVDKSLVEKLDAAPGPLWIRKSEIR